MYYSFSSHCFLLIPRKTSEHLWFSQAFRGIKREHWEEKDYDDRVRLYWEKDILSNWLVPVFFFICFPVLFLISHQSVDIRSLNFIFKSKDSWITILQELLTDYPRCLRAVTGHEKQIEIKIISNEVKNSWRLGDNDNDVPRLNFIVNHFCFIILIILTKVKKL